MKESVIDGISTFFVNSGEYRNVNSGALDCISAESSAFPILFYASRAKKAQTQIHRHTPPPSPQADICLLVFIMVNRKVPPSPPNQLVNRFLKNWDWGLPKVRKDKGRKGMRVCSGNEALLKTGGGWGGWTGGEGKGLRFLLRNMVIKEESSGLGCD